MKLPPLFAGKLLKRYKRFLADVKLDTGEYVTALCPNTGSMLTCKEPGSPVLLSKSNNPKRKTAYTWELVYTNNNWVGINTGYPNKIVKEAILDKRIPELTEYDEVKSEVNYGKNSRIDLLLKKDQNLCYVEIKNVTLVQDKIIYFPDAVTQRGTKHLNELMEMVKQGHRAVMFYLVQRSDGIIFQPAKHIDPVYADTLKMAVENGVEICVYQARISQQEITIEKSLPWQL